MKIAMLNAQAHGLGMAVVRNGSHFGAAGVHAVMCAQESLIGIIMSTTSPIMSASGAQGRQLSNAPIAYGVPASEFPIVLDIALSVVAGQKVHGAAARGESIPEGWITDSRGLPSTDPNDYVRRGGALLPLGDHKGSGLALLVEVLSMALSGVVRASSTNIFDKPDEPSNVGHAFIAISPEAFLPLVRPAGS